MQRKPAGVRSKSHAMYVAKNLTVPFDVLNVEKTSIPAIPGASQFEASPTLADDRSNSGRCRRMKHGGRQGQLPCRRRGRAALFGILRRHHRQPKHARGELSRHRKSLRVRQRRTYELDLASRALATYAHDAGSATRSARLRLPPRCRRALAETA